MLDTGTWASRARRLAHLQRELREALRRGGDGWIGNGDRGQSFDFATSLSFWSRLQS
jgi:hypothetical protein